MLPAPRTALAALAVLGAVPAGAQTAATYRVVFAATWSAATHPDAFPADAHFSPLVGTTHDGSVAFWAPGALASDGMEAMAEVGATAPLRAEFEAAGAAAGAPVALPFFFSPGAVETTFTATDAHPLLTLVTMLAPSPDWFVGVAGLDLRDPVGGWQGSLTVDLAVYDAGTDSGPAYTSPDADTSPPEPVALLTAPPFHASGLVGTYTLTRLSVAGECGPDAPPLMVAVANPARPGAAVRVDGPPGDVAVDVVGLDGRRAAVLRGVAGGTVTLPDLPAGVYALRARAGAAEAVRLVTVVR